MKGARQVEERLGKLMGVKVGETSADGRFTLKRTNWLGWCVNDAPGLLIKKKGSDKIIPVLKAD